MPGGNGQITVTGRVGHGSAASAGVAAKIRRSRSSAARLTKSASLACAILPSADLHRKPPLQRWLSGSPRRVYDFSTKLGSMKNKCCGGSP